MASSLEFVHYIATPIHKIAIVKSERQAPVRSRRQHAAPRMVRQPSNGRIHRNSFANYIDPGSCIVCTASGPACPRSALWHYVNKTVD